MLQVVNNTPFIAQLLVFPNEQGVDSAYAVIKGTWSMLPEPALAKEQVPLILSDQFWGEPGLSSLKYASEATLIKPATDVFLLGNAYPPDGEPASQVDVSVRVGSLSKNVRVFGDREWKKGILSMSASSPQPFDRMPLVYERAFGGTDKAGKEEQQAESEPRNPVGVGFRGKKSSLPLEGTKLPNLENPRQLISSPKDRPVPAGFGPIPGSWEPRRSKAGTYDEAWQKSRAPYLPSDFDVRFLNAAPPDLQAPAYLVGGELVEINNASKHAKLSFQLPKVKLQVIYMIAGENMERVPNLDTVTLEPDHNRFTMVWRTVASCDKQSLKVRQIQVEWDGHAAATKEKARGQ